MILNKDLERIRIVEEFNKEVDRAYVKNQGII